MVVALKKKDLWMASIVCQTTLKAVLLVYRCTDWRHELLFLTTVFQMDPCLLLSSGVSRTYELVTSVLPQKSHWLEGLLPTPTKQREKKKRGMIRHGEENDQKFIYSVCCSFLCKHDNIEWLSRRTRRPLNIHHVRKLCETFLHTRPEQTLPLSQRARSACFVRTSWITHVLTHVMQIKCLQCAGGMDDDSSTYLTVTASGTCSNPGVCTETFFT